MRVAADDLGRVLAEMCDLGFERVELILVINFFKIDAVFIGKWEKDVSAGDSVFSALFVAVNEVNPVVDMGGNVVALELCAELSDEAVRVGAGPGRQQDVVDRYFVLGEPVVVVVDVKIEFREGIELWDEFSEVSGRSGGVEPGAQVAVEQPVSHVEAAALQRHCPQAERAQPHQEVKDYGRRRVVAAEVVLAEKLPFIVVLVFLQEVPNALSVPLQAHVLRQITVCVLTLLS